MADGQGHESWFETVKSPLYDADGNVVGIAGLARDITERKQVEADRQALAEQRQLVLDAARMGWWHYDIAKGTASWDDRFREVFGITEYHQPVDEVLARLHPDDLSVVKSRMDAALAPSIAQPYSVEFRVCHSDGSLRWVESHGVGVFEEVGPARHAVGLIGTVADITSRKRAEQDNLEMERRLLHTQKLESLGVLAGGIAHDFNNILSAILGYTELLNRSLPPSAPAHEDLGVIRQAAQRAADLTRQLLAYSGKASLPVAAVDLSRIVEETRKILEVSVSKKAVLRFSLSSDLPAIEADATRVHQVVLNLVTNASDALGDCTGRIEITTDAVHLTLSDLADLHRDVELPAGRYVRFMVEDNGCGMNAETLHKVFDPYFTTKVTGHGLGLAAVQGIVRGHRGAMRVTSSLGTGTTFEVFFPASLRRISEIEHDQRQALVAGGGLVLVADDEDMVRNLAQRMLELAGYSVVTAANGEEAVGIFEENKTRITCLLLDLSMPKMDGLEALQVIRQRAPEIRAVLCSGYPAEAASRRFGGLGVSSFVQKPFQFDSLVAAVSGVAVKAATSN